MNDYARTAEQPTKRISQISTNGENALKKNIMPSQINFKSYIKRKIRRKLANAKKSGMREEKPKD